MAELLRAPAFPDEPPHLAVVVDRDGLAWQRKVGKWCTVGSVVPMLGMSTGTHTWPSLLMVRGPVTVVHYPEQPAETEF